MTEIYWIAIASFFFHANRMYLAARRLHCMIASGCINVLVQVLKYRHIGSAEIMYWYNATAMSPISA